jgi:Glycosyltransferase family 92
VYLSLCAMYRDEGPYLAEWIEFHRLVGVERLVLYNNRSRDNHREVLAPYIEEGVVIQYDWPGFPEQPKSYRHCIEHHGSDTRWLAFLDLDEFLFSPTGRPVSEVLREFEYAPGVCVNRCEFGTSGHRTRPSGLVIENYSRRTDDPELNGAMKSIVDVRRTALPDVHLSLYREGSSVNENHEPVSGRNEGSVSFEKLRVNHYFTRSEEEFRKKSYGRRPNDGRVRISVQRNFEKALARRDQVTDTTIIMYAPALRAALARRQGAEAIEAAQ